MWVEFSVRKSGKSSFVLDRYRLDGEEEVTLSETVSTPETIQYILTKSKSSVDEILGKGNIRVNMRMAEFQERIVGAAGPSPEGSPTLGATNELLRKMIAAQQQQAAQQMELMRAVTTALSVPKPRTELVRPDTFDASTSPQAWVDFYEYACEKNNWITDSDKVKNLRLFLTGMPKKWYELKICEQKDDTWLNWKESFLSSFQENAVDRWDRAIFFKYRSGSPLEYFYEKRKLLQLADSALPESSVVPLMVHGLSRDLQKQVLIKGPTTVMDLLKCFKELCVERFPTPPRAPAQIRKASAPLSDFRPPRDFSTSIPHTVNYMDPSNGTEDRDVWHTVPSEDRKNE